MSKKWFTQATVILGLFGFLTAHAIAGYVEAEDVQKRFGDPSPSDPNTSNINNYIYQDEQLNLNPSDGLVKVLRTDQKILTNDYVNATIPIEHAPAREIRNVMRQVTGLEGGRAEVIRDKVSGDSYVQVLAPSFMIPYLRKAIEDLDVQWLAEYNDGSTDIYVKMKHAPASLVDSIAANYGGEEGFSQIDTTNNAVRRLDENYRNNEYIGAVKMVDIPYNQVDLEVKVYEVNVNNDMKLGVDYLNWSNGPGRNLFDFAVGGYSAEQRAKSVSSVYDPFIDARGLFIGAEGLVDPSSKKQLVDTAARESYRSVNFLLPSSYVDFLQAKGQAKVITGQNLTVRSGATGVISNLDTVASFVVNENDDSVVPNTDPVYIVRQNGGTWFIDINGNSKLDTIEVNLARLITLVVQGLKSGTIDSAGSITLAGGITVSVGTGGTVSVSYGVQGSANVGVGVSGSLTNLLDVLGQMNMPATINDVQEIIKGMNDALEDANNVKLFIAPGSVKIKDYTRRVNYTNSGSVGMKVQLTPYVGLESMEMEMALEMGELNGYSTNGMPIINTRTVATTVRLLDGQPYAIAALKKQHDIQNSGKAPLLGDLPGLGYLFGGETNLKRNDEVVVTVTRALPSVLAGHDRHPGQDRYHAVDRRPREAHGLGRQHDGLRSVAVCRSD